MKRYKTGIILGLLTIGCCSAYLQASSSVATASIAVTAYSQELTQDTTNSSTQFKVLTVKEDILKKKIKEEDKKRNATYNGASPETIENLQDRQDSICLDLRSQLIGVQLEIKEIKETNVLNALKNHKKKENK